MRKRIIALLTLGLLITVTWSIIGTSADMEVTNLSVGDQWTYAFTNVNGDDLGTRRTIIDRIEDFEGVQCYVCIEDFSEYSNETVWMTSDWVVLKTYMEDSFFGSHNRRITIYDPGMNLYDFPLSIGKEWAGRSYLTVSNIDSDGEITGTGFEIKDWSRKVVSKETITVPAGTFDCYVVEELIYGRGKRFWFSEDARNYVKMELFGEMYPIEETEVLTSYELAPQNNGSSNLHLPIALAALIGILGFTSILYYHRNRIKWGP